MRTKRLKRIKLEACSHYHVMSRIAERCYYLGEDEKAMFCEMMERVALFSGIHILTYCIMDNHFHLLIEVPERESLTLEEIKKRLPFIYRGNDLKRVLMEFKHWEKAGNVRMVEELKQQYERRMFDLSEFMKTLKQRFSIWYNRNHDDRKGTLWEEDRFVSVLIEPPYGSCGHPSSLAILIMAAYIELNPVRAGIVADPMDYPWCGYGSAMAGMPAAQNGIELLVSLLKEKRKGRHGALQTYREHLYLRGKTGGVVSEETAKKEEKASLAEMLYRRIRYFSSGLVLGSEKFVYDIIDQNRDCFSPKTIRNACPMRGNRVGLCFARIMVR